jgi:hypothetical protein
MFEDKLAIVCHVVGVENAITLFPEQFAKARLAFIEPCLATVLTVEFEHIESVEHHARVV